MVGMVKERNRNKMSGNWRMKRGGVPALRNFPLQKRRED